MKLIEIHGPPKDPRKQTSCNGEISIIPSHWDGFSEDSYKLNVINYLKSAVRFPLLLAITVSPIAAAGKPENVLVVVNQSSALSRSIGDYYARQRGIPAK